MSYLVQWSASALDRLLEILDFIARENPRSATRTVDEILERVEMLADFPRMGPVFSDESGPDLRKLVLDDYLVVYLVRDEKRVISVIAVRHSRQRPMTLADLEVHF